VRSLPQPGAQATVLYLDAAVPARIEQVEGRVVGVVTEEGERLRFTLNAATGAWLTADPAGPRLRLG
jgi:hypothetical protein